MKKCGFFGAVDCRSAVLMMLAILVAACGGSAEVNQREAQVSVGGATVTAGILADQGTDNSAGDVATSNESYTETAAGDASDAEDSPLKIMAVGDSITHGYGGASSYRKPLLDLLQSSGCEFEMVGSMTMNLPDTGFESPHEAYSGHLTDAFLTGQQSSFGNNEGISQSMLQFMPELVLMNLGTNDMNQNRDVDDVIANVDQIVALIFDAEPLAQVVIATLVPYFKSTDADDAVNIRLEQFSNALEAWFIQSANPRVFVVDIREGFTAEMMLPDFIHPGNSGDAFIADKFYQSIADNHLCG